MRSAIHAATTRNRENRRNTCSQTLSHALNRAHARGDGAANRPTMPVASKRIDAGSGIAEKLGNFQVPCTTALDGRFTSHGR